MRAQLPEQAPEVRPSPRIAQQPPDRHGKNGKDDKEKDQEGKVPDRQDQSRPKREKAPPDNDPPDDEPNPRGSTALGRAPYSEP